jgi:hypothetical protein
MRTEGLSLKKAAKEAGVSPRTVAKRAGRAIKKGENGRYVVSKRDSLLRVVQVPTSDGSRDIALRNSRQASTLAQYWDAVQKYLRLAMQHESRNSVTSRSKTPMETPLN